MEIRSPNIIDTNPAITIGNERIVRAFQDLLYRPAYPIAKLQDYCQQIMHLFAGSLDSFQVPHLFFTRYNRSGCFFDHSDALLVPPIENNAADLLSDGTIHLMIDANRIQSGFNTGSATRTTYHTVSTFNMKASVVVLNLSQRPFNPIADFISKVAATARQMDKSRLLLHVFYQVARDFLGSALGLLYQDAEDQSWRLLASQDCVTAANLTLAHAQLYQCQYGEGQAPRYRIAPCSNEVVPDANGNLTFNRLF